MNDDFVKMTMSPLDRAVDKAIRERNDAYLKALKEAGPGACPNCLGQFETGCWLCAKDRPRREES